MSSDDADPVVPAAPLAAAGFDDLVREVAERMRGAVDESTRLQLLLDAVLAMAADLTLDGVLVRIVEIASRLAGARYAALGVLSTLSNRRLRTFVHHGVDPEQAARIGSLPTGEGLLGLLVDQPEPIRLSDIAAHPASCGFPPGHPPMHSFLGVPVRVRGRVFGNLYLSEKVDGGDFTQGDEDVVVALAAAAGVAIENARLHEEAAQRERWLAATAEISTLLSTSGPGALQTVADRARDLSGCDVAWVAARDRTGALTLRVVSGETATEDALHGVDLERSLAAEVVADGAPRQVSDLAAEPGAVDLAAALGWPALGPALLVPLGSAGSAASGVLGLAWTPERAEEAPLVDARLPAGFAEQAALALTVARAREDQQRLALLEDRDRIARDLHDLVIQRLFAVGLGLQSTARRISDRAREAARLERAVDDVDATISDIRRTIFALGSMEESDDVQAEVTRMVDRARATLKFRPSLRLEGPVRTMVGEDLAPDLLAVLSEALSNASRHSGASAVDVVLSAGPVVELTVADNGRGLPAEISESGLANMRRRAEDRGGSLRLESSPATGTRLVWSVPARPGAPDKGPPAP